MSTDWNPTCSSACGGGSGRPAGGAASGGRVRVVVARVVVGHGGLGWSGAAGGAAEPAVAVPPGCRAPEAPRRCRRLGPRSGSAAGAADISLVDSSAAASANSSSAGTPIVPPMAGSIIEALAGSPAGTTSAPGLDDAAVEAVRRPGVGRARTRKGHADLVDGHGISRSTHARESAPEICSSSTVTTTSPSTKTASPVACGARAAKPGDWSTAVDSISA